MRAERLLPTDVSPDGYQALSGVEAYIRSCGLEATLIELVKFRASQINGCAFCLDLHSNRAKAVGEADQRIFLLSAWRESRIYTPRECAALAWTESLTLLSQYHGPDEDYLQLKDHFTSKEIVDLTILIGMINLWNRLAVGMRYEVEPAGGFEQENGGHSPRVNKGDNQR